MTTFDPVRWLVDHRDGVIRWTVIVCVALLLFLLVRHFAMKLGGWRAAWRRLTRELALTAAAFASPVRAWLRYRRVLRILVRRLGDPESWRDAERALAAARLAAAPARPYAVLVDDGEVTVLLAGRTVPSPVEPWEADEDLPDQWTARRADLPAVVPAVGGPAVGGPAVGGPASGPANLRADVQAAVSALAPEAGLSRPVVVAIGAEDGSAGRCAFLDLMSGPPTLALDGDRRARAALLPALGAQLGVRLPPGLVIVADGVLRDFAGEPVREAYRRAKDTPTRLGTPPFLVAPELPDPLPPELAGPPEAVPATRILVLGSGRGYVRRLYSDGHGQLALQGTPLLLMAHALPQAVARTLKRIPPVHPPAPTTDGVRGLFEEDDVPLGGLAAEQDPDEGIPTTAPARTAETSAVATATSTEGVVASAATPLPSPAPSPRPVHPAPGDVPAPGTGQAPAAPDASATPDPDAGPLPGPTPEPASDGQEEPEGPEEPREPREPKEPFEPDGPDGPDQPDGARHPRAAGPDGGDPSADAGDPRADGDVPVIWAGSDSDPGRWTGLAGPGQDARAVAERHGEGPHGAAPATDPSDAPAPAPTPDPDPDNDPGPEPTPTADPDTDPDTDPDDDPDAGVPAGPAGVSPRR
ncbi:hypothetical protein [Streptomyces sp. NPDC090022]|uniref:hypothetical protein n=1 Tax=Streptomyces sp. NPDC090022 TaxID=3365920 RepID=UPI003810B54F